MIEKTIVFFFTFVLAIFSKNTRYFSASIGNENINEAYDLEFVNDYIYVLGKLENEINFIARLDDNGDITELNSFGIKYDDIEEDSKPTENRIMEIMKIPQQDRILMIGYSTLENSEVYATISEFGLDDLSIKYSIFSQQSEGNIRALSADIYYNETAGRSFAIITGDAEIGEPKIKTSVLALVDVDSGRDYPLVWGNVFGNGNESVGNSVIYSNFTGQERYFYVTGSTYDCGPKKTLFVAKFQTNGDIVWRKCYGDGNEEDGVGTSIIQAGEVLAITGYYGNRMVFFTANEEGEIGLTNVFGTSDPNEELLGASCDFSNTDTGGEMEFICVGKSRNKKSGMEERGFVFVMSQDAHFQSGVFIRNYNGNGSQIGGISKIRRREGPETGTGPLFEGTFYVLGSLGTDVWIGGLNEFGGMCDSDNAIIFEDEFATEAVESGCPTIPITGTDANEEYEFEDIGLLDTPFTRYKHYRKLCWSCTDPLSGFEKFNTDTWSYPYICDPDYELRNVYPLVDFEDIFCNSFRSIEPESCDFGRDGVCVGTGGSSGECQNIYFERIIGGYGIETVNDICVHDLDGSFVMVGQTTSWGGLGKKVGVIIEFDFRGKVISGYTFGDSFNNSTTYVIFEKVICIQDSLNHYVLGTIQNETLNLIPNTFILDYKTHRKVRVFKNILAGSIDSLRDEDLIIAGNVFHYGYMAVFIIFNGIENFDLNEPYLVFKSLYDRDLFFTNFLSEVLNEYAFFFICGYAREENGYEEGFVMMSDGGFSRIYVRLMNDSISSASDPVNTIYPQTMIQVEDSHIIVGCVTDMESTERGIVIYKIKNSTGETIWSKYIKNEELTLEDRDLTITQLKNDYENDDDLEPQYNLLIYLPGSQKMYKINSLDGSGIDGKIYSSEIPISGIKGVTRTHDGRALLYGNSNNELIKSNTNFIFSKTDQDGKICADEKLTEISDFPTIVKDYNYFIHDGDDDEYKYDSRIVIDHFTIILDTFGEVFEYDSYARFDIQTIMNFEIDISTCWSCNGVKKIWEDSFPSYNEYVYEYKNKACSEDKIDLGDSENTFSFGECENNNNNIYLSTFSNLCSCNHPYEGSDCSVFECNGIMNNNTNLTICSGNGTCEYQDHCACEESGYEYNFRDYYYGSNCENVFNCYGHDFLPGNEKKVCSGHGECSENGNCSCDTDYGGLQCDEWTCHNTSRKAEDVCGGHGICTKMDFCLCRAGYFQILSDEFKEKGCILWYCGGKTNFDQDVCGGPSQGYCEKHDKCECLNDFKGEFCDTWSCGFDYKDENTCNGNGVCVGPGNCDCDLSYGGEFCDDFDDLATAAIIVPVVGLVIFVIVFSIYAFFCCSIFVFCCCYCLCCCVVCFVCRQRLQVQKFGKLKNFDILLKEQQLEEDTSIAHIRIKKELYEIPFEEIKVDKMLGEGGSMSMVFKAFWKNRVVAFKCFKTRLVCQNQDKFDEFETEVQVLSSLKHPNIIQFFGATMKPPRVGIIMEYCEHGDMTQFLQSYKQNHDFGFSYPQDEKDVFSFAIMLFIIFTEIYSPYGDEELMVELKVSNDPNFRPDITKLEEIMEEKNNWIVEVVLQCWNHESENRYSFNKLATIWEKNGDVFDLQEFRKSRRFSIMQNFDLQEEIENNEKRITIEEEEEENENEDEDGKKNNGLGKLGKGEVKQYLKFLGDEIRYFKLKINDIQKECDKLLKEEE